MERLAGGDVERFLSRVRGGDLDYLVDCVRRFMVENPQLAPKTLAGFYLPFLKKFLRLNGCVVDWELVKLKLELPRKHVVRLDRAPTINEVRKIILACRSKRLQLLVWLLATTGLRVGEALKLRIENLNLDASPPFLLTINEKTGGYREVFLTQELVAELKKYIASREGLVFVNKHGGQYHYSNAERDFRSVLKRLGLLIREPGGRGWMIHFHSLRKFYKTRLEEAGVNTLVIETWLGHDLGVSAAYFRPTRRMLLEEWRKAEKALTLFPEEDITQHETRLEELEKELHRLRDLVAALEARLKAVHRQEPRA